MTLYTRGYRRYEHGFDSKGARFRPILGQGYRDAVRGKAFRRLNSFFLLILVVHCAWIYLTPKWILDEIARHGRLAPQGAAIDLTLRYVVTSFVTTLSGLLPLLVVFVGSGLVAEDLRTRALALYLVRPLTPLDYWLGKLLIPASVVVVSFLTPALLLLLFGILVQPSSEMLAYASVQGRTVLAILAFTGVVAIAYSSLVLLLSTWTARRIPALIGGAAVFYGGELVRGVVSHANPPGVEFWRATSLMADARVVFHACLDEKLVFEGHPPSLTAALLVLGGVTALSAIVVLRRARTVEVTS